MQEKPLSNKTPNQLAQEFITKFISLFKGKHGYVPSLNRYTAKYPIIDMMQDVSYNDLIEVLEYYFYLDIKHSIQDFSQSYTEIMALQQKVLEDAERRRKIRDRTRKMVKQYRETNE